MAAKSLTERVAALEAQVGSKSIEEQFREQAELIDRLFIYRFDEFDTKWEAKLDIRLQKLEERLDAKLEAKLESKLEAKLEQKFEQKFEEKLGPIRTDIAMILARLA